jgi:hypothetical protein
MCCEFDCWIGVTALRMSRTCPSRVRPRATPRGMLFRNLEGGHGTFNGGEIRPENPGTGQRRTAIRAAVPTLPSGQPFGAPSCQSIVRECHSL